MKTQSRATHTGERVRNTRADASTMKLPGGCFGSSKDQDEIPQPPRRIRKDRPQSRSCHRDCEGGKQPGSQQCSGCHRRGAVHRRSREQSASTSRLSSAATEPLGSARNAASRSAPDGFQSEEIARCRWARNAQGWNDQQRELDTQQLRRPPSRKPVPPDQRRADTRAPTAWHSPQQRTSNAGDSSRSARPDFIGLSIARAVSPLNLDEVKAADPTFPPSPVTPEGEKRDRAPWG